MDRWMDGQKDRGTGEQLRNRWVASLADTKVAVQMESQLGDGWAVDRGTEGGREGRRDGGMEG